MANTVNVDFSNSFIQALSTQAACDFTPSPLSTPYCSSGPLKGTCPPAPLLNSDSAFGTGVWSRREPHHTNCTFTPHVHAGFQVLAWALSDLMSPCLPPTGMIVLCPSQRFLQAQPVRTTVVTSQHLGLTSKSEASLFSSYSASISRCLQGSGNITRWPFPGKFRNPPAVRSTGAPCPPDLDVFRGDGRFPREHMIVVRGEPAVARNGGRALTLGGVWGADGGASAIRFSSRREDGGLCETR